MEPVGERGIIIVMAGKKTPKRTPIRIEHHKGIDRDKFADKIADAMIDAIEKKRKEKGLPPLK